jgi:hypothetical protein
VDEWERHIAQVFVDTEKSLKLPQHHLIAQNIVNGSKKIENPDPNVSVFNFHYCNPPDAVGENFALNRPIAYDETGGREKGDDYYRVHAWQFILAGGSVLSHLDFSFTAQTPEGTSPISAPGGGGPEIRRQLQVLRQFMDSFDYLRMQPDNTVLAVEPRDEGVTAYALVEPGRQYAIYLARLLSEKPGERQGQPKGDASGKATKIRLNLPGGKYEVEWINPSTGEIQKSPPLKHATGEAALDLPKYDRDVALRLKVIQYSN